jgi:hypothetical protein
MDNSDSRSIDKNKTIKIIGGILAFNVVAFIIAKKLEESNLASSTIPTFPQTILVNVVFFVAAFSKRFYFLDKITIMAMTVIVAITSFSMYGADYNSLRGLSAFVDGVIGTIATVIIVGLFIYAIIFRKKFEAQRKGN